MNLISNIQEIIDEINNSKISLSLILQKCLRLAYYLNDIENIIWLEIEATDCSNPKVSSETILAKISKNINQAKLSQEEVSVIYKKQLEAYLERRRILQLDIKTGNFDNEKCNILSIANIENDIKIYEGKISRNIVPTNLQPLDSYFANKEKGTIDTLLEVTLSSFYKIIESVKSNVYSYLIQLENKYKESDLMKEEILRPKNKNVFIIHGHNEAKWRELEKLLKEDFQLNPIILQEQADKGCSTIIDKFEYYASDCSYAFAIFTPDDVVENNGNKYFQARPNLIFELGWFSSHLGRKNVCILLQEGKGINIFSDFQGVLQKRFYNNVAEIYREIKLELKEAYMI